MVRVRKCGDRCKGSKYPVYRCHCVCAGDNHGRFKFRIEAERLRRDGQGYMFNEGSENMVTDQDLKNIIGRVYEGRRDDRGNPRVIIHNQDNSQCDLDPADSLKVFNHSPDGFEWGYQGSGPAQLALAILLDLGVDKDEAVKLHQEFKSAFIARAEEMGFAYNERDIRAWVRDEMDHNEYQEKP